MITSSESSLVAEKFYNTSSKSLNPDVNACLCLGTKILYIWPMNFLKVSISHLVLLLILFIPANIAAQYYIVGQDPASIKWKQLNSPDFKIIFPSGYEKKAQEYVNLLELSHTSISLPYLHKNKKFQIVLHNQTVISNAMVSPTPMHADFFEMPDQTTYAQPWAKQLTLHEYRHVAQMQKLNQGMTKALYYMFGDQAIGAVMGVFLPMWFIEGDAVFSETIFSKSGRGRSPDFTMGLKAQVLNKKIYPYDKALFGSFRDYVPDHYTLGYELVLNGNINYGHDLWNNTLNKVARRPYLLFPFTKAIKDITGTGKVKYYENVIETRKNQWAKIDSVKNEPKMIVPENNKYYTNYRFINPMKDGSVIAEKSGIDNINTFVKVFPDGTEKKLFTPGYDFNESLSANDSLLCWNEKAFDPRWTNRDYSVIKIYNYRTKKLRTLTRKSRLFAPSLDNMSSKVVAVNVSETNSYSLRIYDIETGDVLHEFSTSDNLFFMFPRWSDDDKYIVSTVLGDKGKSIIKINTTTWEYEFILPTSFVDITRPVMKGNKVIFLGTYLGTSDLYMIDITTSETFKLTNVRFGASDATFSGSEEKIYFTTYTNNGFRISTMQLNENSSEKVTLTNLNADYLVDQLKPENDFILDDTIVPNTEYPVKKYSRIGHLINLHSWGLAAVDLNNYDFTPGVSVLTQNILSTAYGSLGYYYDHNEQAGKTKLSFEYAGWYPVINISADYGQRRTSYLDDYNNLQEIKWMETNFSLGVSVPLNLTKSRWVMGIRPYVGGAQKFLNKISHGTSEFKENQITSLTYNFYAYTQLKRSKRDIYPKWGINTNIIFRHTPLSDSISTVFGWTETIYIPGILKHHGIRLYSAYQNINKGNYSYSNVISTPRGYTSVYLNDMFSSKIEYALPIFYPDFNIPAVAYLKRVTAHLFYDQVIGDDTNNKSQLFNSAGLEIYTDWNFLSLFPNIRLGVRGSYRFKDNLTNFEFLYGFSIN
ncbi:MAG: hypothetical protein H8E34_07250 [Bacteroidetes bacterium]|nr:hypothetical protein [Bacteroidota bacterium]MBL6943607.1 hypothetical protein [Bacteroidales bacterium]